MSNALVILDKKDYKFSYLYKYHITGVNLVAIADECKLFYTVKQLAKKYKTNKVYCAQKEFGKKLLQTYVPEVFDEEIESFEPWYGSYFEIKNEDGPALEVIIIPDPYILRVVPMYKFLMPRWAQKLTNPNYPVFPELHWYYVDETNWDNFYALAQKAFMIGEDIETKSELVDMELVEKNPELYEGIHCYGKYKRGSQKKDWFLSKITYCAYSLLFVNAEGIDIITGVVRVTSYEDIERMGKLNATKAPKVFQNGLYDNFYFLRYNIPVVNWVWDTHVAMHAWLVEAPRDLSFLCSLFNKKHLFWKDEMAVNEAQYNAKDTHNMTAAMFYMIINLPKFAKENYAENFKMVFPCLQCSFEGFKIDHARLAELKDEYTQKLANLQKTLEEILVPGFNANSSTQCIPVALALGFTVPKKRSKTNPGKQSFSFDDKVLQSFKVHSALAEYLGTLFEDYRETLKILSTYLNPILIGGRYLFGLGPANTDTGRMNSNKSPLWTGGNIQNQPAKAVAIRSIYIRDDGYNLNDIDNKQSETRWTGYLAREQALIDAVEDTTKEFHKNNAAGFFGLLYEEITKILRELGKRINHGANYNMQPPMLLETMGIKLVVQARKLLKLKPNLSFVAVCKHLLGVFDGRYPRIRGAWQEEIKLEIKLTKKLTGPLGWVRVFFGDPSTNRQDLNAAVAHGPQSGSVKHINIAFFKAWYKLQLCEQKIRMKAQIHDSITWQDKPEDTESNAKEISELMMEPVTIHGKVMIIPNDPCLRGRSLKDLKS